ncbi:hypothetical protein HPB48_011425 [Haemaphysalis longicornis]|uniref:Galactosyltransferase N-terminal domain-containing protein n=1 Tax=Haemaphysalis longicornis TaxID=44386 RepID=A0A9J6GUV2_HAELO|nr:hypothetical protein HPB48_011425 [Haemaphysalis longicornis]
MLDKNFVFLIAVGYIEPVLNVGSLTDVIHKFPHVSEGGRFKPNNCTSRHRVAILIPYRNRSEHLNVLLYNLHRFLAQQQLDYGVFVIEQVSEAYYVVTSTAVTSFFCIFAVRNSHFLFAKS